MAEARRPLSIARFAPAKLNLFLHVTGRRSDGYHELDSLVVFLEQGDLVEVEAAPTLKLDVLGPGAPDLAGESDNLALRAARALAAATGCTVGAAIRLTKELPVASGLGGGSSDAAAALRALIELWRCEVSDAALAALGLDLGADVPACLQARPLRLQGIGERLDEVPLLPEFHVVLANPGVPLVTGDVFAARRSGFSSPAILPCTFHDFDHFLAVLMRTGNDLEPAACSIEGEVARVLSALGMLPGARLARMSGSGATCFALFADRAAAERGAARLQSDHPNWWIRATRILDPAEMPSKVRRG